MGELALDKFGRMLVPFNIIIALILTACSGPAPHAPVTDVGQPPSIRIQEHIVARGETLYSIAWRYNLDHRALARANALDNSHTIYPGQRLSLDTSRSSARKRRPAASSSTPARQRQTSSPASPQKSTSRPARSVNQTAPKQSVSAPAATANPGEWQWPLRGKILASFDSNGGLNKGIDIGGKLGESVLAAAGGKVVYSGSGLRGYGNLIIVKHSEKYLSAYAHNSKLLVEEGATVKAGQKIAEVGSSGTDATKLHFEIRNDGKPVDPLRFLPRL